MPQVAVVTGGSSGIGAAVARKLTERGWSCVLVARGEERLRAVAGELGAEWERCDVGDRSEVERVAAAVSERHPRIQLLVNNAGRPGRGGFTRLDPEQVEEVLRVHGYDNIPVVPMVRDTPLPRPALDLSQKRAATVRRALASRGLVEAVTFSFLPRAQAELFGGGSSELTLVNPISADLDVMRRRGEWFEQMGEMHLVLWWVEAGHVPIEDIPLLLQLWNQVF